jgi:hypothetical protein
MDKKSVTNHFRGNIFESLTYYTAWKTIAYSKAIPVVGKVMAEKYVEIQHIHAEFFTMSERACLISFIMLVLHPFDTDIRSFSLHKVDKSKTDNFIKNNREVLDALSLVRNKVFAHSDIDPTTGTLKYYPVPSLDTLDQFYINLIDFYNELCREVDDSTTIFENAKNTKYEIESLFMNIERGESTRRKEIDIEYLWSAKGTRISDII